MICHPSPNHGPRPAGLPVDMLVIHYTGMRSAGAALARLCDPAAQVSAHYLIDEDGSVCALVPEDRRAWHAGLAQWRGYSDVNGRSIGIELVNPGHEWGYRPFPDAQISALVVLARAVVGRHPIAARNVVGHADVAPARKADPGELFPWPVLAGAGVGLWPTGSAEPPAGADAASLLAVIGYPTAGPAGGTVAAAVRAFQRHFRPTAVTGSADAETLGRMAAVAALC